MLRCACCAALPRASRPAWWEEGVGGGGQNVIIYTPMGARTRARARRARAATVARVAPSLHLGDDLADASAPRRAVARRVVRAPQRQAVAHVDRVDRPQRVPAQWRRARVEGVALLLELCE